MHGISGFLPHKKESLANGRGSAMLMAETIPGEKRVTLGGDKNYDTQEFVRELRGMNISPHVAQNTTKRRSAVDNYEVLVVEDSD